MNERERTRTGSSEGGQRVEESSKQEVAEEEGEQRGGERGARERSERVWLGSQGFYVSPRRAQTMYAT